MTDRQPDACEFPSLRFDPYRHLAGLDHIAITSAEDTYLFDEDEEEDVVPLYSVLAQPGLPWITPEMWADVPSKKDDPITAGMHFVSAPQRYASDGFTLSKVYVLPEKTAKDLLENRGDLNAAARKKILGTAITAGFPERRYVPIGYGTLKGHFGRLLDFVEGDEEVTDEERDPNNYKLWVEPSAFFVRPEFRGNRFGYLAGVALASPLAAELWYLRDMSETFNRRTRLAIEVYAEIHSFGGDAAVKGFLAGLRMTSESMPPEEESGPGLFISDFVDEVSW